MEAMLGWMRAVWPGLPGTVAIYGAFLMLFALAFYALYERRTLKLRPLEGLQYFLGFSIPLLAATHVSSTRINDTFLGGDGSHYMPVLTGLSYVQPGNAIVEIALLAVACTHVCIG